MTTLVVQMHPLEDSYSAALLDALVAQAPDAKVLRLGQGDRWTTYSCIDVTRLVVVYPTWWGSLPAMLSAALDDLIGPWVDGEATVSTSPLGGVRSLSIVTTHGSSKFVNMLQGEPGLQLWKRTVLPLCAKGASFRWQSLYKIDRAAEIDRVEFLRNVTVS